MASLVLKPVIPNIDLIPALIAVSTSPRNTILINLEFSGQHQFHPLLQQKEEAIYMILTLAVSFPPK